MIIGGPPGDNRPWGQPGDGGEYAIGIDWAYGPDRMVIVLEDKNTGRTIELPAVRMHKDWLLVWLDPDVTITGLIHHPQGSHDSVLRTGTVVLTGLGKWAEKPWLKPGKEARNGTNDDGSPRMVVGPLYRRLPLGVEVGERVLFIKFAVTHTETSKRVQAIVGKDFGMIQPPDILLAGPDVDKVR